MDANDASGDLPPSANPIWGAFLAEQYLVQNWPAESAIPPDSQRRALLRKLAFNLTAFPSSCYTDLDPLCLPKLTEDDLPRVPTASEVSIILKPWRTIETRSCALAILQRRYDREAVVLRTHYGDDDKWVEMMETREIEDDGFEMEDEGQWSVLDNANLFAFGDGEWARVFEVLPELSRKREFSQEGMRNVLEIFRARLKSMQEAQPEDWAAVRKDMVERCRDLILVYCMDHYLIVGDSETFESEQFLVLFLDVRNNIVKQARIPPMAIGTIKIQVWRGALADQDCWIHGELGEKYKVDGEIGRGLHAIGLSVLETAD